MYAPFASCPGNSDFLNPLIANQKYYNNTSNYINQNTALLNLMIADNNK